METRLTAWCSKALRGAGLALLLLLLLGPGNSIAQVAPPAAASPASTAGAWDRPAPGAPLPARYFFRAAKMQAPALSPSGRWLAMLSRWKDERRGFLMIDVEGQEAPRFLAVSGDADVVWFRWLGDEGLLFTVGDLTGNRSFYRSGGMQWMNREGSKAQAVKASGVLLDLGPAGSNDLLIAEPHYDVRGEFSHIEAVTVNAETGKFRRLLQDAPRFSDLLVDAQGQPRLLSHYDADKDEVTFWWTDKAGGAWREMGKWKDADLPYEPQYFDGDGRLVVLTDNGSGGELRVWNPATGRPDDPPLLATPGFSGDAAPVREREGGAVAGLRLQVDASTTHWFGEAMQRVQAEVDARLPGRVNVLSCRPCDKPRVVLVSSYADVQPGEFFFYRPAEKRWQALGEARPDIDPARMAPLDFHRIRARDGRDLPLWVTRPAAAAAGPAPAVVLVHGGPYMRGKSWGWDSDAQFLASRGWVVIEPEFRGSLGFGKAHFRAGWKQWGLAMQDDVSDALKFAVDQGWVDPSRACIVGASYGGYAALMGLVKDPAQYRCGVAFAAVTDIRHKFDMFWSDAPGAYRRNSLPQLLGDKQKDEERFIATSPVEQVARIQAPLLLMHGALDRRVPVENGERMRDALTDARKDFEWVLFPEAGHGFAKPEDRLAYWQRIEAFLARHLNAPASAANTAAAGAPAAAPR